MTGDTAFVFILLGLAGAVFASGRVRLDLTALFIVLILGVSGILTVGEAVAGFGDPVVILVACLLVVGEMLQRTGVVHAIGNWLVRAGGKSEIKLLLLLMVTAAFLGSVMSSTAVVALLIPVTLTIARRTGLNASRLLLPMAYGALISGMMTLIATTPNLVVSAELEQSGFTPFSFFGFTPVGLAVLVIAMLYMVLIGRRLLPGETEKGGVGHAVSMRQMLEEFQVLGQARRLRVTAGSPLAGRSLSAAELNSVHRLRVVAVERPERRRSDLFVTPNPDFVLKIGDAIVGGIETDARPDEETGPDDPGEETADTLTLLGLEELPVEESHRARWLRDVGFATILIHPESRLAGSTLRKFGFRSRHRLQVMAAMRGEDLIPAPADTELRVGDALLVVGTWGRIHELRDRNHDFIIFALPEEARDIAPARRRMPMALTILAGMVLLSALNIVPVTMAVLIAALASVVTGCVSMEDSYRAIHWSSLVLIAGMLPIAAALNKTGGVDLIVDGLVSTVGPAGPYAMMSALFLLTAALGSVLSNTATAVLMAPIAIAAAQALGIQPYAFAMAVVIAASAAFLTPVSSPVVTLVVTPGGYGFKDFLKVGTPLLLLTWGVTLLVVPRLFPF